MATPQEVEDICDALEPLRAVVSSLRRAGLGDVPASGERRKFSRAVRAAGNSALPALMRSFVATSESESSWGYYLLSRLGGTRVVDRIGTLLKDPQISDEVKARALGLLSDLDAPVPADVALKDPDALLEKSVRDLLRTLDKPREMAQAVSLILEQVPEPELPTFGAELVRHGGARAMPLLHAITQRTGLTADTREALAKLKRQASGLPEPAVTDALDRGLEYLEAGKPKAAARRLKRFCAEHPENAEGRSALGVCLLQLDDFDGAIENLDAAARLEPDEPLHRWNVAAACKQADRVGGAYLALRDYLKIKDDGDGARERRSEARGFVRAYERMLRDSHPGVALTDYLRGEELFARAYAALSEGRAGDALQGFEAVLKLVPRHYPSWGNLGAAYLQLERKDDARRCLDRALELNPEYAVARKNLQLLESPQTSRP